jgi:hypothetical protein
MRSNNPFPTIPLTIALCAAMAFSAAAEANVNWVEPGTSCKPREARETFYRYDPPALKNISSSRWDVLSAICPFSQVVSGKTVDVARVFIKDPLRRSVWCSFLDLQGQETGFRWNGGWNSQNTTTITFTRTLLGAHAGQSYLVGTFLCPLQNGASLERLEVVFLNW